MRRAQPSLDHSAECSLVLAPSPYLDFIDRSCVTARAQHSAGDFDDHYRRLGGHSILTMRKLRAASPANPRATVPCDDWHRSLDTLTMCVKVTALSGLL